MPYTVDDVQVLVTGNTGNGETWVNSWTFRNDGGAGDLTVLGGIVHDFYEGINDEQSAAYSAVAAEAVNLSTGLRTQLAWSTIIGDDASVILPSQLAVRLSLVAALGVRGGPFLPGWSNAAITTGGALTTTAQADIGNALGAMFVALAAADWVLSINRPSLDDAVDVLYGKVGRRFDVIRKRANDTPENYITIEP